MSKYRCFELMLEIGLRRQDVQARHWFLVGYYQMPVVVNMPGRAFPYCVPQKLAYVSTVGLNVRTALFMYSCSIRP